MENNRRRVAFREEEQGLFRKELKTHWESVREELKAKREVLKADKMKAA